jgi:hypothetical protein
METKMYSHVHKRQQMVYILVQIYPVHTLTPNSLQPILMSPSRTHPDFPSGSSCHVVTKIL